VTYTVEPLWPEETREDLLEQESFPTPDISMGVESHGELKHLQVEYQLKTKTIGLHGSGIPSDPKYWRSSGAIVSVLDLPGTQIIIHAEQNFLVSVDDGERRVEPDIRTIVLNIA
jgi:hypothetical protein